MPSFLLEKDLNGNYIGAATTAFKLKLAKGETELSMYWLDYYATAATIAAKVLECANAVRTHPISPRTVKPTHRMAVLTAALIEKARHGLTVVHDGLTDPELTDCHASVYGIPTTDAEAEVVAFAIASKITANDLLPMI